jgi:GMP synthase (glutamine-hydrolysing)
MAKKLALLKVGKTSDALARERGDYERWFREGLGIGDALELVDLTAGHALPDPNAHDGVVVTGSAAMVTDREPWSVAAAAYLVDAFAREKPILGVCYGHQLLADALGGEVDWNPRGRQIGTVLATLTDEGRADALLGSLGEPLYVQTSHKQVVRTLPEGAVRLASSPLDPNHAFRIGARAWGVQFHPEFDGPIARTYVEEREEAIRAEGRDPEALAAAVIDSPQGRALLQRFAELALCP